MSNSKEKINRIANNIESSPKSKKILAISSKIQELQK